MRRVWGGAGRASKPAASRGPRRPESQPEIDPLTIQQSQVRGQYQIDQTTISISEVSNGYSFYLTRQANSYAAFRILVTENQQISRINVPLIHKDLSEPLYYVIQKDTENIVLENGALRERNYIESHVNMNDGLDNILINNGELKELKGGFNEPGTYYSIIFYITETILWSEIRNSIGLTPITDNFSNQMFFIPTVALLKLNSLCTGLIPNALSDKLKFCC